MLTWIAASGVLGALAMSAYWATHRGDGLGRPRRFPVISVVLLCLVAVGAAVPVVLRVRLERRLSRVASELAGRAVHVHCQTFGEAFVDTGAELGFVRYSAAGVPEPRTIIKREQCSHLADYSGRSGEPSIEQVIAVHVLTHEAMHMSGITNEAHAECAALQRDTRSALLLGADAASARLLTRTHWREIYPHMPDTYRSDECRAGGSLDEGLPDPPWG